MAASPGTILSKFCCAQNWEQQMNLRSGAGFGEDGQIPTDTFRPLLHTNQSEAATQCANVRIEPGAIVFDGELDGFRSRRKPHINLVCSRMLHGVGDRFLRDAQQIAFDVRRHEALGVAVRREIDANERISAELAY